MATVEHHYEHHLGPVYAWTAGGLEAGLLAGAVELDELDLPIAPGTSVIDLGAGFGMHAVPLARRGAKVLAIDTSAELLQTLEAACAGLPVKVVNDDLLAFQWHIADTPSVILCMGDTITHLAEWSSVESLVAGAAAELPPGGLFILSFRDYTAPLAGDQRFIPVRSDDARILTCFLEYRPEFVLVHDILHERTFSGWQTRVSHYRKLRLSPGDLTACLQAHGFQVRRGSGLRGMVRLVATRT
ncbi:MAG TPA: methyltransferase domain-containing protein [Holophagaceae bacterium]|nr:methyltransferase domain-containing protein [Holophagaceae bacterium]